MKISIYELSDRYLYPAIRGRFDEILYYEMKLKVSSFKMKKPLLVHVLYLEKRK